MIMRQVLWPLAALALAAAAVLAQRAHWLPANWWLLPWVLSFVCFGLPHGAVDHDVVLSLYPPPRRRGMAMATVVAAYLAVCLLALSGWFVAPRAWFGGFVVLTWAHWGLADLWWSWNRDRGYFTSRGHRVVFALWRGALPMLVPLAADPGLYRRVAAATCGLFLPHGPDLGWLEFPATRAAALVATLGLGVVDFVLAAPRARTRWLNLVEGASLLMFFGTLPALASVGLYFAFWHGLRHIERLLIVEGWTWPRLVRRAVPNTLGAIALLTALALIVRPAAANGNQLVGIYLALIAALTVPHALVVAALDARAGLWRRSDPAPGFCLHPPASGHP